MIGKILIVDDEPGALKLLKDILEGSGHSVRPFNNGNLALQSIRVEAPELILLDIRMPDMDGYDVCRQLKEDEFLKEIPVIFISAASDTADKVRAFQEGGVDYITKPFQKEEVISRIKTHIALSHTIRDMKKLAADLQKSEESLKMAQAIAHLGHWELEIESGQFICSEEMYRILGLESHGIISNNEGFLQTVHPDDRQSVANHLNEALAGNSFDIEYRIILPDGTVRVVHGKAGAYLSQDKKQMKIIGTIQHVQERDQTKILGVIQDITEQKELENRLEQQANTDVLTGCASRRHFMDHAEAEFLRMRRYGGEMSILMLDLDHFKEINDKFGHQVGDEILKKFVQVCQGLLRRVDVIGRLGGEEFAILLPETGVEHAFEIARRLCQVVAGTEVPMVTGPLIYFTTSIGVASLIADDTRVDTLLNRADNALYKAKNAGRNMASV